MSAPVVLPPPLESQGWIPARTIRFEVKCRFCGVRIPRCKPGSSTGDRGTKAWFNPSSREWECLSCHDELTRAELAIIELTRLGVLTPGYRGMPPT